MQDMKNQVMTTNVWLRHEWYDHKVRGLPIVAHSIHI